MNHEVLSQYGAMSVGEAGGVSVEGTHTLTDARRHELDMVFTFELIGLERDGEVPGMLPTATARRAQTAGSPLTSPTTTSPVACRISATPTPLGARRPPRCLARCC